MTDLSSGAVGVASPHAIRSATFTTARHGYDEREVRSFLDRVAADVEAADGERASLRTEAAELRAEVERLRSGRLEDDEIRMEISVRAVELLSRAQQAADDAVAQAEQYARDLVMTAREQYRDVLQRAQQAASRAQQEAAGTAQELPIVDGTVTSYTQPVPEIEYVRTYARVAQVQLRSVLDALTAEVDKLGQLPRLAGADVGAVAAQGAPVDLRVHAVPEPPEPPSTVRWLPDIPVPQDATTDR